MDGMTCYNVSVRKHKITECEETGFQFHNHTTDHQIIKIFWHKEFGFLEDSNALGMLFNTKTVVFLQRPAPKYLQVQLDCQFNKIYKDVSAVYPNQNIQFDFRNVRGQTEIYQYNCTLDERTKSKYFFVRRLPRQLVYKFGQQKRHFFAAYKLSEKQYVSLNAFDNSFETNDVDKVNFEWIENTEKFQKRETLVGDDIKDPQLLFRPGIPLYLGGDMLVRQCGQSVHFIQLSQPLTDYHNKWVYQTPDKLAVSFGYNLFFAHHSALDVAIALGSILPPYVLLEVCRTLSWFQHTNDNKTVAIFIKVQQFRAARL